MQRAITYYIHCPAPFRLLQSRDFELLINATCDRNYSRNHTVTYLSSVGKMV